MSFWLSAVNEQRGGGRNLSLDSKSLPFKLSIQYLHLWVRPPEKWRKPDIIPDTSKAEQKSLTPKISRPLYSKKRTNSLFPSGGNCLGGFVLYLNNFTNEFITGSCFIFWFVCVFSCFLWLQELHWVLQKPMSDLIYTSGKTRKRELCHLSALLKVSGIATFLIVWFALLPIAEFQSPFQKPELPGMTINRVSALFLVFSLSNVHLKGIKGA